MCATDDQTSEDTRTPGSSDEASAARLLERVYEQLRAAAQRRMNGENAGHTLQATALVHEAFVRLAGERREDWGNEAQFYAAAAEAMRRILVEHARSRGRVKRGGGQRPGALDAESIPEAQEVSLPDDPERILALDDAIRRVEARDARLGEVVRLRFYAGLSIEQTATVLGVSERTVKRDWLFARAWLLKDLSGASPEV